MNFRYNVVSSNIRRNLYNVKRKIRSLDAQ